MATTKHTIDRLSDDRLRVREPIVVTMDTENGQYIAEAPEISEFGFGQSPAEAVDDLQQTIAELYFSLEQDKQRLGPDLAQVWATLNRKLSKASPSAA